MKKIKFLIASMLGAIALVFACVLGTNVNAADLQISFTSNAYNSAVLKTTSAGSATISNVSNGEVNGWYIPTAVSNVSVPSEYYVSFASASSGKITKIGNATNDAQVANIPSKFKANITISSSNVNGYVCAMSPIDGLDKITFTINNTKTKSGETFVLVTSDGTNYYKIGDTLETASLNLTKTITLNQLNEVLEANNVTGASTNTKIGYAVILTAANKSNICTDTWNTTYYKTIQTDATTYDVKFYDVNNNELTDLAKTIAENEKVSQPSAPTIFGKQLKHWAVGSAAGAAYNFSQAVTSDLNLYAVYEDYETDNYSLTVSYMKYAGDYYGTSNITADKPLTPTKYTFVYGDVNKNYFASDTKSVGSYGNSTYAIKLAGSVQTNGGSSLNINLDKVGKFTIYARSGSDTARKIRFYTPGTQNAAFESADTVTNDNAVQSVTVDVTSTGEYNIGSNGGVYIYAIIFTPYISNDATTTVDVEKSGDEVRFITTVSGVEIANIKSLELVLWKNEVLDENKNANNLQMTTLYTSVINATKTYNGGTNIYYGIVKIYDVSNLKARSINKLCFNVIVTFQDNSTKSMDNALEFEIKDIE